MKIIKLCFSIFFLAVLLSGCRHTVVEAEVDPQSAPVPAPVAVEASIQQRLAEVEALIAADKLKAAQETLAPLLAQENPPEKVVRLARHINAALVAKQKTAVQDKAVLEHLEAIEDNEVLKAASRRIEKARSLINRGELEAAQELLAPLITSNFFPEEVRLLAAEINEKRAERALKLAQQQTVEHAMREVEERLILPENYGDTVIISRETPPLEIPEGPMEGLVKKLVTMRLQNAGIRELIIALSEIDNINIIADEALMEDQTITISVKDVPLQEVLSYVARNMGVAFHLGANTIWITESLEPPGSGPKLETKIYRLHHGFIPELGNGGGSGGAETAFGTGGFSGGGTADTELEDALAAILTDSPDGATYRIFRKRNVLVVRDTRENLRVVEQLLKELDQVPMQVLIEARFVTISQDDLFELGFTITQFDMENANPGAEVEELEASTAFPELMNSVNGARIAVTGILGNYTYEAVLRALQQNSSTRTLSAPRVTVLNNQTARIRKGTNMYYTEELEAEPGAVTDNIVGPPLYVPSGEPIEIELGITLDVAVNIGNDGRSIFLSLYPQLKNLLDFIPFSAGKNPLDESQSDPDIPSLWLPRIIESSVQTSLLVDSGQTVVLGGTIETRKTKTVNKVPLLGDIPLLGFLFRTTVEEDKPEHLLMFVTATVIGSSGEFVQYTEPEPLESVQ